MSSIYDSSKIIVLVHSFQLHCIFIPPLPSPVPTQSDVALALYISVGVGGVVVVLIAAAVIVISVTVCLKKRKSKHVNTLTGNVAYGVSGKEMEFSDNPAYTTTSFNNEAGVYDYVATDTTVTVVYW